MFFYFFLFFDRHGKNNKWREVSNIPSMNLGQKLVLLSLIIFLIHVNLYMKI